MSCFAADIYGNVQEKGGEKNGYEKDRRISKNTSQGNGADTRAACGNSSCIRKNRLTVGNRNEYAGLKYPYPNGGVLCGRCERNFRRRKEKRFGLTFAVCAAMIVIQLLMTGDVAVIAGETVVLLVGGVAYIGVMTYNGIWESGSGFKSAPFTDVLIAVVCAGAFAIALAICYIRLGAATSKAVHSALIFFAGITIVNFGVLRILAYFSYKRKDKNRNLY